MTTPFVKQKRAKTICLNGIKAAFKQRGIVDVTLSDLRDRSHPLQSFPIATRNSATDHNGAVFEHAYELVEELYDTLGKCPNPGTSFEYRVFNLLRESPMDVLAFIDNCDEPEDVINSVADWQERILNQHPARDTKKD